MYINIAAFAHPESYFKIYFHDYGISLRLYISNSFFKVKRKKVDLVVMRQI